MNLIWFAAFLISCVIITVCFTKKRMAVARTLFLGVGIFVGVLSAYFIYIDSALIVKEGTLKYLGSITTYLLAISTIIFNVVWLVVVLATVILSVFAFKKIVECFKGKELDLYTKPRQQFKLPLAEKLPHRKIFVLFCRLLN